MTTLIEQSVKAYIVKRDAIGEMTEAEHLAYDELIEQIIGELCSRPNPSEIDE